MTSLWSPLVLLPSGWASDVAVEIDNAGRIASVKPNQPEKGNRTGPLLPAPVNVHSHAFQRAMAGLTEFRGPDGKDSFWSWRRLMYRFLERLTPDQVQAIAALVQMEMLESGYATNVEFHYLHHAPGGQPYDTLTEMADRITAASDQSGIGLTLLPVLYRFGGCDGRALTPGQDRFGNTPDRFTRLVEALRQSLARRPDATLGIAPHSLRAIAPSDLEIVSKLARNGPMHMHIAEQQAEVDEVQTALGARPVEWLLDNADVNNQWCLIHCTQMQPNENKRLAQTGAVAGLCPITESSLGDGIFDGVQWMAHKGRIAIGSDSNIRISLSEELRTLEYSQRLRDHARASLATRDRSTGRTLYEATCQGGAQAAGRATGQIAPGLWADLMAFDPDHIDLAGQTGDSLLDTYIFAGGDHMVRDVWSAGRHMVQDGRHIARDGIVEAYKKAITPLREAL